MLTNEMAAAAQLCPGIRNQVIDIDHPPGIEISPIADIHEHQAIVAAALAREEQRGKADETPEGG